MGRVRLVETKKIDMYHFQMYEGKFEDLSQAQAGNEPVYVYANISNFETETFEESAVRIYAHSYKNLQYAQEYELVGWYEDKEACNAMKKELIKAMQN